MVTPSVVLPRWRGCCHLEIGKNECKYLQGVELNPFFFRSIVLFLSLKSVIQEHYQSHPIRVEKNKDK